MRFLGLAPVFFLMYFLYDTFHQLDSGCKVFTFFFSFVFVFSFEIYCLSVGHTWLKIVSWEECLNSLSWCCCGGLSMCPGGYRGPVTHILPDFSCSVFHPYMYSFCFKRIWSYIVDGIWHNLIDNVGIVICSCEKIKRNVFALCQNGIQEG